GDDAQAVARFDARPDPDDAIVVEDGATALDRGTARRRSSGDEERADCRDVLCHDHSILPDAGNGARPGTATHMPPRRRAERATGRRETQQDASTHGSKGALGVRSGTKHSRSCDAAERPTAARRVARLMRTCADEVMSCARTMLSLFLFARWCR